MEMHEPQDDYSVRMSGDCNGVEYEFLLNKKYDHLVRSKKYGAWLLKVVDAEHGFVQMAIDEEQAMKIHHAAGLRIAEAVGNTELSSSEVEFWREAQGGQLEEWFKD